MAKSKKPVSKRSLQSRYAELAVAASKAKKREAAANVRKAADVNQKRKLARRAVVEVAPPRALQPGKASYGGLGVAMPSVYIPFHRTASAAGGEGPTTAQASTSSNRNAGNDDEDAERIQTFMKVFGKVWGCHVDGWSSSGRPNSAARRRQVQKGMEWRQRLDAKEVDEKRRAASAVDDAGGSSPVRLASATSVAAAAEASKLAYAKMKQKRHMQASGGASRDTGSKLQHNAQRRSMLFNFVGAVAMR